MSEEIRQKFCNNMKILWFNISVPKGYNSGNKSLLGGWQDSLEDIIKCQSNIELYVVFKGIGNIQTIDNVTYIPIHTSFSYKDKLNNVFSWKIEADKLLSQSIDIIKKCNPDIIHVFGTEWPFGLIAKYTDTPVVVHVQGAIAPYYNSKYPPGYNIFTYICAMRGNIIRYIWHCTQSIKQKSREKMERRIFENVKYYMGRTCWDKAVTKICNPERVYFHVDEALRPAFINSKVTWNLNEQNLKKLKLVTVGCSTLYKGLDMMIKTAKLLKQLNVDFEWNVIGHMPNEFRMMVEYKEKRKFSDCNINILGFMQPEDMTTLLCNSTMYVHTAYIENSPNSLCEAQILGVPVVSTNVGGISSLVGDGVDGILVPANDPFRMAYEILSLYNDKDRMRNYSIKGMARAKERHNPDNIAKDLMNCYNTIINK